MSKIKNYIFFDIELYITWLYNEGFNILPGIKVSFGTWSNIEIFWLTILISISISKKDE